MCRLIVEDLEDVITERDRTHLYDTINNDEELYELWKKASEYYLNRVYYQREAGRMFAFLQKKKFERGLIKSFWVSGVAAVLLLCGYNLFTGRNARTNQFGEGETANGYRAAGIRTHEYMVEPGDSGTLLRQRPLHFQAQPDLLRPIY